MTNQSHGQVFCIRGMDCDFLPLTRIWHPLYAESKKKWYKWTYLQNRNWLTDLEKDLPLPGGRGKAGIVRESGMDLYTLLYLKWITNKFLLYRTELCSMLLDNLDGREVRGRMDTCMCMAESLCSSPETITMLLISYTPIQNKKLNLPETLKNSPVALVWNSMD